jgi:hypothetical protein
MNNQLHISISEINRVAPDAFRGLGLAFGRADRATQTLVWGEAVQRRGLRFLRLNEQRIRASVPREFRCNEVDVSGQTVTVDAQGKSTFESGPRALDLANGLAKGKNVGIALVRNTFGLFLLGEAIARAAQRGIATILLYASAAAHNTDEFEGTGALSLLPAPAVAGTSIEQRVESLGGKAALKGFQLAQSFVAENESRKEGLSSFALLSFSRDAVNSALTTEAICSKDQQEWCHIADFGRRWQGALINGFVTEKEDWQALGKMIGATRIPTSERSRQQAG